MWKLNGSIRLPERRTVHNVQATAERELAGGVKGLSRIHELLQRRVVINVHVTVWITQEGELAGVGKNAKGIKVLDWCVAHCLHLTTWTSREARLTCGIWNLSSDMVVGRDLVFIFGLPLRTVQL
jgi:hypothetical protein